MFASTRPLRVLLVHPGASWSTHDVFEGLYYGLQQHGVDVVPYRLDTRIDLTNKILHAFWRRKAKTDPTIPKPNNADVQYHAGADALTMALRAQVDVVLVVSAMYLHPDVIVLMKRAGLRVTVLFTESPYDHDKELRVASLVDGVWTHERASVEDLRRVNARVGYLPHAWHPLTHAVVAPEAIDPAVPAHDVVFVGSGFPERVALLNAIDWTGINLGLYGIWKRRDLAAPVRAALHNEITGNARTADLYRRARIGLNLYRTLPPGRRADSLSPRAYELAACGVFHLSEARAEIGEVFGDLVPTFTTAAEASPLIRTWLAADDDRTRIARALPACVAEASWVTRAATVLRDLESLLKTVAA